MAEQRVLSEFERGMIVGARQTGHSVSEVVRELNLPRSAVSQVYREFNTQNISRQPDLSSMDSSNQGSRGEGDGCVDQSSLVSEDGKNIKSVLCQRCGSKVLCPGMAVFTEKELFLPPMRKRKAMNKTAGTVDGDTLTTHWLVSDEDTFENVGFTKDVGKVKYLTCADCKIGPIGWHNLDDEKSFYVSLDRVNHE